MFGGFKSEQLRKKTRIIKGEVGSGAKQIGQYSKVQTHAYPRDAPPVSDHFRGFKPASRGRTAGAETSDQGLRKLNLWLQN